MTYIFASTKEDLSAVLPIAIIVILLSVTCVALNTGVLVWDNTNYFGNELF